MKRTLALIAMLTTFTGCAEEPALLVVVDSDIPDVESRWSVQVTAIASRIDDGGDEVFCQPVPGTVRHNADRPYAVEVTKGQVFTHRVTTRIEVTIHGDGDDRQILRQPALVRWPDADIRLLEVTIQEACLEAGCGADEECYDIGDGELCHPLSSNAFDDPALQEARDCTAL